MVIRRFLWLMFFLYAVFLASCGNSDREGIEQVLTQRESAFESKDLELYLSCLDPNYRVEKDGKVIGIEEAKKEFTSNVSLFDSIEITHFNRSIHVNDGSAQVFQKTKIELRMEDKTSKFVVPEKLELKKIGNKWKIVKDSEIDFLRGFVFGEVKQ